MEGKRVFEKYYRKLAHEGILKALLFGLIIGFAVNIIVALVLWFTDYKLFWVAIVAGIAVAAVSALLLYYKKFRPTASAIARRVDGLGLEERLITMLELENDDSYIALRQREDAKEKLDAFDSKKLRMGIPAALILAVCFLFAGSVAMTTVTALSAEGIVPKPGEIVDGLIPPSPEDYATILYVAEEGGFIDGGGEEQVVLKGEDAEPVVAVAEDGYMFVGWDDGLEDAERQELAVTEDLTITAIFEEVSEGDGDGEGGEGEPGDESQEGDEQGEDQPGEGEEEQGNQGESQDPNGEDSDSQQQGDPEDAPPQESDDPGQSAGGQSSTDNNTVRDGNTDIKSEMQGSEGLEDDDSLPPDLRDVIGDYVGGF